MFYIKCVTLINDIIFLYFVTRVSLFIATLYLPILIFVPWISHFTCIQNLFIFILHVGIFKNSERICFRSVVFYNFLAECSTVVQINYWLFRNIFELDGKRRKKKIIQYLCVSLYEKLLMYYWRLYNARVSVCEYLPTQD